MDSNRRALIVSLVALLLLWGAWSVYSGWGLVTLNVSDAPLGQVLAEIRKQGGITVVSNLDPATKVSLQVRRVPAVEALDIVAVRTDASWRLAYLGAPAEGAVKEALNSFGAGREIADWTSYGAGGFSMIEPESGAALDLRRVKWQPGDGGKLSGVLQDAAEKTGVLFAAPTAWNPEVSAPSPGPVASAARELFRKAGGSCSEVFLLRGRGRPSEDEGPGDRRGGWIGAQAGPSGGRPGGGWMRSMGNAERVEAQIALLPKAEQPKARENFQMMRDFWQSVRDLPEEERRAKAREFFSRPEVVEEMETRRLARWAKMTPEQRIDRNRSYWERKGEERGRSR